MKALDRIEWWLATRAGGMLFAAIVVVGIDLGGEHFVNEYVPAKLAASASAGAL